MISCQSRPRGECLESRRLACVGCACVGILLRTRIFPSTGVSQARRLRSRLRSVAFGGCLAAQCFPLPNVSQAVARLRGVAASGNLADFDF